jgi:cyclin-dependent kinase
LCILQQALFPGDSELQQLLHIFKLLGTPDESTWPGVTKLRDWHEFPQWRAQDLHKVFPSLSPEGVALMERLFTYDPAKRISVSIDKYWMIGTLQMRVKRTLNACMTMLCAQAKEALNHPYFNDLDKEAVDLLESDIIRARECR